MTDPQQSKIQLYTNDNKVKARMTRIRPKVCTRKANLSRYIEYTSNPSMLPWLRWEWRSTGTDIACGQLLTLPLISSLNSTGSRLPHLHTIPVSSLVQEANMVSLNSKSSCLPPWIQATNSISAFQVQHTPALTKLGHPTFRGHLSLWNLKTILSWSWPPLLELIADPW